MESNENNMAEDVLSTSKLVDVTLPSTIDPETGCEIFDGCKGRKDYGSRRIGGKTYKTHRIKWIQENGPIPEGYNILHKCDNPPCININHLFLGTQKDNMKDMRDKERSGYTGHVGINNTQSKLKEGDIPFIRMSKGLITLKRLSEIFNVSISAINHVQRGYSWTHV